MGCGVYVVVDGDVGLGSCMAFPNVCASRDGTGGDSVGSDRVGCQRLLVDT